MTVSDQATPPSVTVALRMPVETVETLRKVAAQNERTFSQEMRLTARKHIENQEGSASS